jgi:hypothetical protein
MHGRADETTLSIAPAHAVEDTLRTHKAVRVEVKRRGPVVPGHLMGDPAAATADDGLDELQKEPTGR